MNAVTTSPRRNIQTVMKRLATIAGTLSSEGLEDQAKSIETTIADLQWQCEELDQVESAVSTASSPRATRHQSGSTVRSGSAG